ncbi:uncharacterized protein PITG_07649 [Phytophthora infestans T30-4]|uniref:CST complex subunit CTC1 n=1 Tax=Phytophthora infestans (strain T30-4) TaxID=403677 RepID=D0N8T4_PHYIT|nr:uncharacterized protein PITG_07649 [Phytophthora infestans T30-4]EEY53969.1 hypothetical protein PITG_07649 [Phytophthora infestans T30-4]|eukprot:XP_002904600.1 hypothetical protein PITG_07649 [Phytophthora infestans T30-4]
MRWNVFLRPGKVVLLTDLVKVHSRECAMFLLQATHRQTSCRILDFEGQVCRLLWDECIELQGPQDGRVIVCLLHFPYTHELVRLRKGATIRVSAAHVLRWPTPVGGNLVLGLCPRSHLAVTSYSNPSEHCIAIGTRSRRGKTHKKWSSLGDFHRQSMVLSMWLLEVLELLDSKFFFVVMKSPRHSGLCF